MVGDFCVDAYWTLSEDPAEVSQETGLPVRRVSSQAYGLGGAGNLVANLSAIGVTEMRLVGVVGNDPYGQILRNLLAELGVDDSGLLDMGPAWETLAYAKPYLGRVEQERFDFGTRSELPPGSIVTLLDRVAAAAGWASVVVINQQVRGCFTHHALLDGLVRIVSDHPRTVFVVDARDSAARFEGAILKLNESEAERLALGAGDGQDQDIRSVARRIAVRTRRPVFVTRGERGISVVDGSGSHEALGIEVLDETDPVGAGDTVTATIAAVLASGGDIRMAADLANLAASVTVRKLQTTGTATLDELARAAERCDFVYAPDLAAASSRARLVEGTEIELVADLPAHPRFTHAIFDHDGTLSTLRQGWEDVMEPMMLRAVLGSAHDTVEPGLYQQVRSSVREFIDRTTGVQTLVQMQGLAALVRRWGFVPRDRIQDEHAYKAIFNDELMDQVRRRRAKLASGQLVREDFHLKGALSMLRYLRDQGLTLHLASGTDVADVIDEAHALGFGEFFGDRIHGAVGDATIEAKRVVLERLVEHEGLEGGQLITFGDGPVEMRVTRKHGGIAVGVCSDERRRFGFNPLKRERLIRGGAMALIPDFSDLDSIVRVLGLTQSGARAPDAASAMVR